MKKDPAFLFYSEKYYEGTRMMLPEERGIYVDLLIYQHQNKYIPNDPKRLCLYCSGATEEIILHVLNDKFILSSDGWYNEKLLDTVSLREEFSGKQKTNGIVGQFFKKSKNILPLHFYNDLKNGLNKLNNEIICKIIKNNTVSEAMLIAMLEAIYDVNIKNSAHSEAMLIAMLEATLIDFNKDEYKLENIEAKLKNIEAKRKQYINTNTIINNVLKVNIIENTEIQKGNENFIDFQDETLVSQMLTVFHAKNKNFKKEAQIDSPAILQIAYKIAKLIKCPEQDVLNLKKKECVDKWVEICNYMITNTFFSKQTLYDISRDTNWQRIITSMETDKDRNHPSKIGKKKDLSGGLDSGELIE